MKLDDDDQELVNFFAGCELPAGPQPINDYSVFLNLSGAVSTHLQRLHSDGEASPKSATLLLREIRQWVESRSHLD